MTIYPYRTTLTSLAGATSSTTLDIIGGLLRQVLIVANTASTVFQPFITDEAGLEVSRYGLQTGEMSDLTAIPVRGRYTISITNASPNDTFRIFLGVQE